MHRPAIIGEARQVSLEEADFEWTLMGPEGTAVSFSEFKDDVVFLSIWATWCPPCRAEMPNIQQLFVLYGNRVRFVLASQEEPETTNRFMEERGYTMPVYRLVQNPPSKLSTSSIPTTFLIAPGGKIHVRKTGAARWDGKFFRAYLDEMLAR